MIVLIKRERSKKGRKYMVCSSEAEKLLESEKGVKVLKLKQRREKLIKKLNDQS